MQVHTAVVTAGHASEESHTILGRSVACPHDIATTPRGRCSINRADGTCSIFTAVVRDIQPHDRRAAARGRPLDEKDLGNLPILTKVFIGPQGRNELETGLVRNKG